MFERITFDPNIMGGRSCIRTERTPVSVIVGQIAHSADLEEILDGYADLEREDIQQAIEYASWLTQEQVHTFGEITALSRGRIVRSLTPSPAVRWSCRPPTAR